MSFRCIAISAERFAGLAALNDAELHRRGVRRVIADDKPGYPCRITLEDAEVGEPLLLLNFAHHDVDSPYRGSGPIYIRPTARATAFAPGQIPAMFAHRRLSVRAYNASAMMLAAEVVHGSELAACITRLLGDPAAAYLHVHNAGPGCYNCRVERV